MNNFELENWLPMELTKGPPLPRFLNILWPWYKPPLPEPPEEIVTVRLKNPPSGAKGCVFGIQSHDEAHTASSVYTAIDEPITHQVPGDWFPLYYDIAFFSAPLTKPILQITNIPSLAPWVTGYDASLPLITDYGSYYFNVATRQFEKV